MLNNSLLGKRDNNFESITFCCWLKLIFAKHCCVAFKVNILSLLTIQSPAIGTLFYYLDAMTAASTKHVLFK